MKQNYRVKMWDGSIWSIPVRVIALDRARYYCNIEDISFEESLNKDTIPLFESDSYEIEDWARNNMNWKDVEHLAIMVKPPDDLDFEDGWVNGEVEII